MYGIENALAKQLSRLKKSFGISGVKAEFESEGSTFRDVVRLRRITAALGIKLFLKIGGVEAVRDIKDSLDIGADGLIAPMVESKFGVKKFIQAYESVYKKTKKHLTINVETKNAISQIDEILDYSKGRIDAVTIGRTDLSSSYFKDNLTPDSKFIVDMLELVGKKIRSCNLEAGIGGSLSRTSVGIFKKNKLIQRFYDKLETRKIILPINSMMDHRNALAEALKFEELYILSKKEINDACIEADIARLTQLERRL